METPPHTFAPEGKCSHEDATTTFRTPPPTHFPARRSARDTRRCRSDATTTIRTPLPPLLATCVNVPMTMNEHLWSRPTCALTYDQSISTTQEEKVEENENQINHVTKESDGEMDKDVEDTVSGVWLQVDRQRSCKAITSNLADLTLGTKDETNKGEWENLRLFVSSTFADFFNEREVLVKKVFPELREWCEKRKLKFLECDLRWGIPRDTPTAETVSICMEEIDRCKDKHTPQPFFIALLGERYGWIPGDDDVPLDVKERYHWVNGTSITFMEILHGALRDGNPNAGFFLRTDDAYDGIPEKFISNFVDTDPLPKYHLKVLKQTLRERFPDQVFDYNCRYRQISEIAGRPRVELADTEEFAEQVLKFLKKVIGEKFPVSNDKEPENAKKQEEETQRLFAAHKAKDVLGRQSDRDALMQYLTHGVCPHLELTEGSFSSIRPLSDWDVQETDHKICVVEAPGGWGKTALMSQLIVETLQIKQERPSISVFYHIVDSSPGSRRVSSLLTRLVEALLGDPTESEMEILNSGNTEELAKLWRAALYKFRDRKDSHLWIIIDGVNQLDSSQLAYHLSWLPPYVPANVRCVVSTNLHSPTLSSLYEHPVLKLELKSLSCEDLMSVATNYLGTYCKKLDMDQLKRLMTKKQVDNPLWMMLMVEELRVFGDYVSINDKIDNFPDSMNQLLVQIIDRLIQEDDGHGVIKKVLCLTASCQSGLPTDDILKVCGDVSQKQELPPLYWARARRSLKPYLRSSGHRGELITFSHEAVFKAVESHLMSGESDRLMWHTVLADYYQFWCNNLRTQVSNLPHHLKQAHLKKRIVQFIRSDPLIYWMMPFWQRSDILKEARCEKFASKCPIMLCHICFKKPRGGNFWSNSMCCVICGQLCNTSNTVPAMACVLHGMTPKCAVCQDRIFISPDIRLSGTGQSPTFPNIRPSGTGQSPTFPNIRPSGTGQSPTFPNIRPSGIFKNLTPIISAKPNTIFDPVQAKLCFLCGSGAGQMKCAVLEQP